MTSGIFDVGNTIRVILMSTPEFGKPTLRALLDRKYEVVGLVCQPDKPAGPRAAHDVAAHETGRAGVWHPRLPARQPEHTGGTPATERHAARPDPRRRLRQVHPRHGRRPGAAAARSTCIRRCCRAGAAPALCPQRSWQATAKPASPCTSWSTKWMPARSSARRRCRSRSAIGRAI